MFHFRNRGTDTVKSVGYKDLYIFWCAFAMFAVVNLYGAEAAVDDDCSSDTDCDGENNEVCVSNTTCGVAGDCASPETPTNGAVDISGGTLYNNQATFSCDTGYAPDATATTTCQADATWTPDTHTCTIKDCASPETPTNGAVDISGGTLYNNQATFSCDTGYAPDATATTTCQADATWTPDTHTCTIKAGCGTPTNPTDGSISLVGGAVATLPGDTGTVTCNTGYSLSTGTTTETITCQAGGSWTTIPTCSSGSGCGTPTNPTDGSISLVGGAGATSTGDTGNVTCNTGSSLSTGTTTETITCQAGGSWTTIPTCSSGCTAIAGSALLMLLVCLLSGLVKD